MRNTPSQPCAQDRAAVVTTAILRVVRDALSNWFDHGHADMAGARAAIYGILRDEFADIARTTLNEIRREDE
jgi:hypothetical protein